MTEASPRRGSSGLSEAERQRVLDRLRDETTAERLSLDEFEERASEAWAATTPRELLHALRDLPQPESSVAPAAVESEPPDLDAKAKRHYRASIRNQAASWVGANAFFGAIWLSNGADGKFWPLWILLPTSVGLVTSLIRGPERERRAAERRWNEQRRPPGGHAQL